MRITSIIFLTTFLIACTKMPAEVEKKASKCLRSGDYPCAEENFRWLLEKKPNDVRIQANLAFSLTSQNKHANAISIYQKLITEGEGSYDLFAYYATSLSANGDIEDAITWNYRALSIVPKLVDVRGKLATLLVKQGRPYEALALLTSFDEQLVQQRRKPYFKGRRIAITSTLPTHPAQDMISMRAAKISDHYYSVVLGKDNAPIPFMIDTGATHTTMSPVTLATLGVTMPPDTRYIKFQTADSVEHTGQKIVLDHLQLGPYSLHKITVIVCDSCFSLLGQTTLDRFDLKTNMIDGIEFLSMKLRL